ncbi:MAG: HEAT repeat domain-containing protein [Deltaproteobacteria bacterium]|nr:HEAT repeat domain-containing protein [Deltaproteobacteria bacterium]
MLPLLLLCLGVSLATGCRAKSSTPKGLPLKERITRIQQQEWRRAELRPHTLREALNDPAPKVRARAALAMGRMGLMAPKALMGGLKDTSSEVRHHTAFALSLLANAHPGLRKTIAKGLRAALESEKHPPTHHQILLAIGHIGQPKDRELLEAAFVGPHRVQALEAWGLLARKASLQRDVGAALVPLLGSDRVAESRAAAWATAQRNAKGKHDPLWSKLLEVGADNEDDTTRLWATRALAKQGPQKIPLKWLLERLADPAASVREAAARAFAKRGVRSAVKLSVALRRLWREAGSNHHRLTGTSIFPVLTGIRALEHQVRIATIRQFAADLLYLSDASDAAVRYSPTEASSVDRVHCAAARLWDLGVKRIERTPTCGTARAADLSTSWRRKLVISTIVDMKERDAEWKLTLVRRYLRDPNPSVREAAVSSLAGLDHPSVEAALTHALDDKDMGVLGAALQVMAQRKQQAFAPVLAKKVVMRLEALKPLAAPMLVCDGVGALRRLGARFALPLLHRLQKSPAAALRPCAFHAAQHLHPKAKPTPHGVLSRGLPDLRWTGRDGVPLPRRAVLVTQRGEIQLELFPEQAPAAVARFARHARKQGFKGSLFVGRGPGRVVLGLKRTPRWQSAGLALPDEPFPTPSMSKTAGLLGMLRGHVEGRPARDSASRAFFITLEAEPKREPDVTIFGRVSTNLEILQRTHVGETIKDLYIP